MTQPLTTAEAAERLGTSTRSIHRMVEDGRLEPAFKAPGVRGAMFFNPADVDELAEAE